MDAITAYLDVLQEEQAEPSPSFLDALQSAHVQRIPFHNIDVLVEGDPRPLNPQALARSCWTGSGGTCYQLAVGFTMLLRGLGFEANLGQATVRQPGDHIITLVSMENTTYGADVGNGHPYPCAWRFDGSEQQKGRFRLRPVESHYEIQHGPDWSTNHSTHGEAASLEDFEDIVRRHHVEDGYGPFRGGLRIIRGDRAIRDQQLLTVGGAESISDMTRLLEISGTMGVPAQRVEMAVAALRRRGVARWHGPAWDPVGGGVHV